MSLLTRFSALRLAGLPLLSLATSKDFRQNNHYTRARDAALQLAQGCLVAPR